MEHPTPFAAPSSPVIATYQYTDIEDGTGLVNYYLITRATSAGTTRHMTTATKKPAYIVGGAEPTGDQVWGSATYTVNADVFNQARTASGSALFSAYLATTGNASYVSVKVQKVSGGVATDISSTITSPTNASNQYVNFEIPLTQTYFARDDNVRIIVIVSGVGSYIIGDPTYATYPTTIEIPYRTDL